jgi:hypothetical protein
VACDTVRADLSAAADGEHTTVDRAHVAGCAACTAFEDGIRSLRAALRFEAAEGIPDVAPQVLAEVARPPGRRWNPIAVAAALLAGLTLGAVVTTVDREEPAVATALPAAVAAAQADLRSLAADITVVEHHPARTRAGSIRYVAPEQLSLRLDDVALDAGDDGWRLRTPTSTDAVRGREPFSAATPLPLDLVLPASGFLIGEQALGLGERSVDGRRATGTTVTAAQVGRLLEALRPAGDGRPVHPSDRVELWLDAEHLTPLELTVTAASGPDRARWAAARRLDDAAGDVVLEVRYRNVQVNAAGPPLPAVDLEGAADAGFRDGRAAAAPTPGWLPSGMTAHRAGTVGSVDVRTWTDGRAWVKVRGTRGWTGDRLFGGIGALVRTVATPAGPVHVDDRGASVAVHAHDVDLVVTGSLPAGDLVRVAGSLPVRALALPPGWAHATGGAADDDRLPLRLPASAGLPPPAVRVDGATITAAYAGEGDRSLLLTVRPGDALSPPLEPDVVGVSLRGVAARWSPDRAELEWVEDGRRWSLRSRTIGFAELVALAGRLAP